MVSFIISYDLKPDVGHSGHLYILH